MPTHVSFECLRDKRANLFVVGLAIPDVSGICPAMLKYLMFLGWFIGSSDMSQEFRRSGVPAIIGSSDVSRLTDLEKFTVLIIPDVFGIHTGCVWYGRPEPNG